MTNKCIITIGLPGSGKSTKAEELLAEAKSQGLTGSNHCTDDFLMENGVYVWKAEKLGWAHKRNFEAFCKAINEGQNLVICSNTNIRARDRKEYVQYAKRKGYEVVLLVVGEFDNTAVKLYAKRNTHGVPIETIQKMAARYLSNPVV